MSQETFLAEIADLLDKAGIPFMIVGSHGSSFYGPSRSTQDIDLVIDPSAERLDSFLNALAQVAGERFYCSSAAAREALDRRHMFNILDVTEGWKMDLIVRKDRPFSLEEFRRRRMEATHGRQFPFATPEDVILSKLEWNKITPSERQVQDALNVAVLQLPKLDRDYLRQWATSLGVADSLEDVLRRAEAGQTPTIG